MATAASTEATALTYTSYEGNSWRLQFTKSGISVLVDPWLVGDLTFGGVDAAYRGVKRAVRPEALDLDALAAATDFILLTMSIDDHAHRPTLRRLPKSLPVVGSASAAKASSRSTRRPGPLGWTGGGRRRRTARVARELGYTTVFELDHGQTLEMCDGKLQITGTAGALVGPPWSKRELGFVLAETSPGGASLYYEPHCDYVPASVAGVGRVDVVVTPPATQSLLGAYDLVKGATDNLPLLRLLRPKASRQSRSYGLPAHVVIPLENAGFDQSGPLAAMIRETGGSELLERQVASDPQLAGTCVAVPRPGVPMPVAL
eukprot:scaffold2.g7356.t1